MLVEPSLQIRARANRHAACSDVADLPFNPHRHSAEVVALASTLENALGFSPEVGAGESSSGWSSGDGLDGDELASVSTGDRLSS